MKSRLERFMEKVDQNGPDGCWIWIGANDRKDKTSYGVFGTGRKDDRGKTITIKAHRWSYEHFVGPIPDGLDVLHKCDVRPCVNPEHLRAGTHDENIKEAAERNLIPKGDKSSRRRSSPLSRLIATEIREKYRSGYYTQTALAREFGVTQTTIWHIVNEVTWTEED